MRAGGFGSGFVDENTDCPSLASKRGEGMILCKNNYLTPKEVVSLWSSSTVSIAAKRCTEAGTHKVSYERSRTRILGKEII